MAYWRKNKGGDVGMMARRDGVQRKMLCVTLVVHAAGTFPQTVGQPDGLQLHLPACREPVLTQGPTIDPVVVVNMLLLTDSTHVRANVRNDVVERVIVEAEPSAYLQRLNEQAVKDSKRRKENKAADSGFRLQAGGSVCGLCVRQLGDTQRHAGHGHTDVHT